jgi:hypothetical protein
MNGWNIRVLVTEEDSKPLFNFEEVYYDDSVPVASRGIITQGNMLSDLEYLTHELTSALNKPKLWGDHRFPEEYQQ